MKWGFYNFQVVNAEIAEPEPLTEPEPLSEPRPEAEPEAFSEPEPISEPHPVAEVEPISEPHPVAEAEPISEPRPIRTTHLSLVAIHCNKEIGHQSIQFSKYSRIFSIHSILKVSYLIVLLNLKVLVC